MIDLNIIDLIFPEERTIILTHEFEVLKSTIFDSFEYHDYICKKCGEILLETTQHQYYLDLENTLTCDEIIIQNILK